MTVDFYAFAAECEARKRDLGLADSTETTAALRNPGGARSATKRAALARNDARALSAGRPPVVSLY